MLEQGMMSFALLGAGWVLWLLVGLSVLCVAVSVERAISLLRDGSSRAALAAALDPFLRDGDVAGLLGRLRPIGGFEARVLLAGAESAALGPEAAEQVIRGTLTGERLRMERGLAVLATTGSNAPFLGLFGTVLGIIKAFHDLAQDTTEASEAVMAGISEALVATAVGLLVAIPAVVLFNVFNRWVRARLGRVDSLADLLVARLRGNEHGR